MSTSHKPITSHNPLSSSGVIGMTNNSVTGNKKLEVYFSQTVTLYLVISKLAAISDLKRTKNKT